jgi:hypothetical protein
VTTITAAPLRPIPCRKCGGKFERTRRQERVCLTCKPRAQRTQIVLRDQLPTTVPASLKLRPRRGAVATADRQRSVDLALALARRAERCVTWAVEPRQEHVERLLTYARSVANGVVPGSLWQDGNLGFRIAPCTGADSPSAAPRPDPPEATETHENTSLVPSPQKARDIVQKARSEASEISPTKRVPAQRAATKRVACLPAT